MCKKLTIPIERDTHLQRETQNETDTHIKRDTPEDT